MSDKTIRSKTCLDYKALHNSGKKVYKASDSGIQKLTSSFKNIHLTTSMDKLKASERGVRRDVEACLDLNDLNEMSDTEMVEDYIQELTCSHRKFVDVHDDLHDALGTNEYKKNVSSV